MSRACVLSVCCIFLFADKSKETPTLQGRKKTGRSSLLTAGDKDMLRQYWRIMGTGAGASKLDYPFVLSLVEGTVPRRTHFQISEAKQYIYDAVLLSTCVLPVATSFVVSTYLFVRIYICHRGVVAANSTSNRPHLKALRHFYTNLRSFSARKRRFPLRLFLMDDSYVASEARVSNVVLLKRQTRPSTMPRGFHAVDVVDTTHRMAFIPRKSLSLAMKDDCAT